MKKLPENSLSDEMLLKAYFAKGDKGAKNRSGNIYVCYARVSSRDQMVHGNSLVWQYERIEEYAEKNNLVLKARYGGTYESINR